MSFFRIVLGLMFTALLAACGGGGGSPGANPNAGPLRTTAGASVVIAPGETRAYTITGGVSPYTVRNADPAIALGRVSGTQLTIQATGIGSTTVEVVDNAGAATSVAVRVGSSTPVSITAPDSLALNLGPSSAQTFDVRGGVAPYTVVSSDPRVVGVYFDPATLKLTVTGLAVGGATVTVRDAANESASFSVSTAPAQSLSVAAPTTLVLAVGGTQTYKILGGVRPYQVMSSNPAVLTVTKQYEDDLVLRGVAGGTATVTVSDVAGGLTSISVTVGSANALFTTAPTALTLAASESSPSFAISGGSAPYSVVSSNSAIAAVTFTGASFAITGGTLAGTAPVVITDSRGTRIQVAVTVTAPGGGSTALVPAASVEVLSSSNTLQSGGTSVDITAFVKNALNVTMANEPVSFSADSGLLQNASTVTDADGKGTAKLLVGNDKSNRVIRVTVRSGTASGFVNVAITGTRVVLTGDAAVQQGNSAVYTVRVLDSSNVGIVGASVNLSSRLNNTLSPAVVTTDVLGFATTTYTAVNASGPGAPDVLTAMGLGASATTDITVSNVIFRFTTPQNGDSVVLNTAGGTELRVEYTVGGVPGTGANVKFSTTRGSVIPSALIGSAGPGLASTTLTSTNASGAGPVTILAQIDGVGQASLQLNFTAQVPATIALQANPSAIPPNEGGGSLSQSTLLAVVRDSAGNAVANKQVNFSITTDVSGGSLSSPSAMTDINGRAQVQYISGAATSAADGVQITASVASDPSIFSVASLTVSRQSLFITIAVGNEIGNVDPSTYSKPFSVYVTDATGNPVGNQQILLTVEPLAYLTGQLELGLTATQWGYAPGSPTAYCKNTDLNLNGFVDPGESSPLRPGNVALATPATVTTNTDGRAEFSLHYGEQYAPWVIVDVIARAIVAGTESSRRLNYILLGSAADFAPLPGPTGTTSPYGAAAPTSGCDPYTGP